MSITPGAMFSRDWSFAEETMEEVSSRYSGFGYQLYEMIRDQFPKAFTQLRFYRSEQHQTDDSFAICEIGHPFGIQLDPDIEVIVLGADNLHTEIGAWADNPCEDAIRFIQQHFIEPNGEQVAAPNP